MTCGTLQANPLNTYLSTAAEFTSPGPLAASAPLTIPVQIKLSDFKLSGFVILVFSKAKGITLVFRNDPLESMKVSSTFDSIPFIADYLQKEIERQVRRLFQEELPMAVHRLSLKLFNPEHAASLGDEATSPTQATPEREYGPGDEDYDSDMERFLDPLLVPPENPDELFSQKNLAHLSSLVDSTKTLSLVTPDLSEVVFRAWASGTTQHPSSLFDRQGAFDTLNGTGASTPYASSEAGEPSESRSAHGSRRPSIYAHVSNPSLTSGITASTRPTAATPSRRRKKNRIVNLRTPRETPAPTAPATPEPVEESAVEDKWAEAPPSPNHHREDSIDYDSRPNSIHSRTASPPFPAPPESVATDDITFPPTQPEQSEKLQHPKPQRLNTALPTPVQEKQRLFFGDEEPRIRTNGSIIEQAFVHKVVKEMRRRIKAERELREGMADSKMWAVERELEGLENNSEDLPAYNA